VEQVSVAKLATAFGFLLVFFSFILFFSLLFLILLVANEAHQMIQHCCGLLAIKFSACLF